MASVHLYKTYMFKDKDPVIDELRTLMEDREMSYSQIAEVSGVSYGTLRGWFEGTTQRPQSATVEAVGRALGKKRKWVVMK